MVRDRQKVRTDRRTDGCTDNAKTISLRLRRGIIMLTIETEDGADIHQFENIPYPWSYSLVDTIDISTYWQILTLDQRSDESMV